MARWRKTNLCSYAIPSVIKVETIVTKSMYFARQTEKGLRLNQLENPQPRNQPANINNLENSLINQNYTKGTSIINQLIPNP